MTKQEELRKIPKIDVVLQELKAKAPAIPERLLTEAARDTLEEVRLELLEGRKAQAPDLDSLQKAALAAARQRLEPSLKRVINATGVLLHTNLGRAPLARQAVAAVEKAASGYSNLEYQLSTGGRGSRCSHVEDLLVRLTGAEAALAVNNNAGALLLTLAALARGREVILSRGELVEIGGSFRIPEVMEQSGAILKEVGTTNKTRLGDYEAAIGPETGAILKVHPSNYRIVGFTQTVELAELTALGRERDVPVIEDLGSGALLELSRFGLGDEPWVPASVAAGAGVVLFSGDKLLGGPQAGILLGKKKYIQRIKEHPLHRALRIDKLSLAALEATLLQYQDEEQAESEIPFLAALKQKPEELRQKAERLLYLAQAEDGALGVGLKVLDMDSQVGGGSAPQQLLPSFGLAVDCPALGPEGAAARLRQGTAELPPLVGRISRDRLLLDVRTIREEELPEAAACLAALAAAAREAAK